LLIQTIRPFRR